VTKPNSIKTATEAECQNAIVFGEDKNIIKWFAVDSYVIIAVYYAQVQHS